MIDPHAWLDPIIAEQRRIQGGANALISEVAEADDRGLIPVGDEMDQWERDAAAAWARQRARIEQGENGEASVEKVP